MTATPLHGIDIEAYLCDNGEPNVLGPYDEAVVTIGMVGGINEAIARGADVFLVE